MSLNIPSTYIHSISDHPPNNPFEGMIWFDLSDNHLKLYLNGNWYRFIELFDLLKINTIYVGSLKPDDRFNYSLWVDTSDPGFPIFYVKINNNWIPLTSTPGGGNADTVDGYETSQIPLPNRIVVSRSNSTIHPDWLGDNSIQSHKLADNSVTTSKIADSAVTNSKLADDSVTTSKIANDSITTPKIRNHAVTEEKLANNSVTTNKIANQSITTDKFHPTAVAPNSDKVDGFHASQTPSPDTVVVSDSSGVIDVSWLPNNINADRVDGFHASQIPLPNRVVVSDNNGYIRNWKLLNTIPVVQTLNINQNGDINWDLTQGNWAEVTLTSTARLVNPFGKEKGGTYVLIVKQDSIGGRQLTFDSDYYFEQQPRIPSTPDSLSVLLFLCDGNLLHGITFSLIEPVSSAGYIAGGRNANGSLNSILKVPFDTGVVLPVSNTLSLERSFFAGINSSNNGYFGGGITDIGLSSRIDKLVFVTDAIQSLGDIISTARMSLGGLNSLDNGYYLGGWDILFSRKVDKLDFNTDTNIFMGDLLVNRKHGFATSETIRGGYLFGGRSDIGTSEIEYLRYITETCSVVSNTLSYGVTYAVGVGYPFSNGYIVGGVDDNYFMLNTAQKFEFSSETVSVLANTLSEERTEHCGYNNDVKGFFATGVNSFYNFILFLEELDFQTEVFSLVLYISPSFRRQSAASCQSGGYL